MKITPKEWRALQTALSNFVASRKGAKQAPAAAVAANLETRFKMELTFPKGFKP